MARILLNFLQQFHSNCTLFHEFEGGAWPHAFPWIRHCPDVYAISAYSRADSPSTMLSSGVPQESGLGQTTFLTYTEGTTDIFTVHVRWRSVRIECILCKRLFVCVCVCVCVVCL